MPLSYDEVKLALYWPKQRGIKEFELLENDLMCRFSALRRLFSTFAKESLSLTQNVGKRSGIEASARKTRIVHPLNYIKYGVH